MDIDSTAGIVHLSEQCLGNHTLGAPEHQNAYASTVAFAADADDQDHAHVLPASAADADDHEHVHVLRGVVAVALQLLPVLRPVVSVVVRLLLAFLVHLRFAG